MPKGPSRELRPFAHVPHNTQLKALTRCCSINVHGMELSLGHGALPGRPPVGCKKFPDGPLLCSLALQGRPGLGTCTLVPCLVTSWPYYPPPHGLDHEYFIDELENFLFQIQVQNELMNSGLYLMLLLHLYKQRFAELVRRNYNRLAREQVSLALTRTNRQQAPKPCSAVY